MKDTKDVAAGILKGIGPSEDSETDGDEAGGDDAGLQAASEDVLSAIDSKDASALTDALKSFFELSQE